MKLLPDGWRAAFRVWRRKPELDVDAELAFHLDERIGELMSRGVAAEAAREQATAEFGDVAAVRGRLVQIDEQSSRRRSRAERLEWIGQDLRYVGRSLRRSPAFVATVALTLALGLGANAAIFSLLNRLYLQAPPGIAQPERVHRIYRVDSASASRRELASGLPANGLEITSVFSYEDFSALQRALPPADRLGGYSTNDSKLGRGADAVTLTVQYPLADFFAVLGAQPQRGRFFQGDELRIETPTPVLVISDAMWRDRFGGRPDIVGTRVDLNYHQFTVIGVAMPDFRGPDNNAADAWAPMNMSGSRRGGDRWYAGNRGAWIRLLATAGDDDATLVLAHAAALAFRQSEVIKDSLAGARVMPLIEASVAGFDHKEVTIATRLAGVALIVLLIACANVANLFLARGMTRRREIAMRLALGVRRRRLIALLTMESVTSALIGGAIALVVAVWGANALRVQLLPDIHWVGAAVNGRVLGFTIVLALATGVAAGLVPALRSSNPDLTSALKGGAREGSLQRSRIRTALLVAQSALSVLLLAGAGVFVRSLHSVETENIGYDSGRIVYASATVDPDHAARSVEVERRLPEMAEQLRRLPGVEATAVAGMAPLTGFAWLSVFLPGRDSTPPGASSAPFVSYVSPEFFATMGMRIVSGRAFAASDHNAAPVMIVNETLARGYWPDRPAVGECLILRKRSDPCVPVVGVVTDGHFNGIIEKPSMQFYLPLADTGAGWRAGVIALRTRPGGAPLVIARAKQLFQSAFAGWAEPDVHAMVDDLARELHPWRTGAALFTAAGLLALLVAIVGIYSTISYTFSQRTHEIGVRVALGAQMGNVVALVVGAGVRVVAVGVLIGIALALAAGRIVESMLYKTSARDPVVLASVAAALLVVAIVACLVPAWRALRVDPAGALRAE